MPIYHIDQPTVIQKIKDVMKNALPKSRAVMDYQKVHTTHELKMLRTIPCHALFLAISKIIDYLFSQVSCPLLSLTTLRVAPFSYQLQTILMQISNSDELFVEQLAFGGNIFPIPNCFSGITLGTRTPGTDRAMRIGLV